MVGDGNGLAGILRAFQLRGEVDAHRPALGAGQTPELQAQVIAGGAILGRVELPAAAAVGVRWQQPTLTLHPSDVDSANRPSPA
jgi:hypothetical protein